MNDKKTCSLKKGDLVYIKTLYRSCYDYRNWLKSINGALVFKNYVTYSYSASDANDLGYNFFKSTSKNGKRRNCEKDSYNKSFRRCNTNIKDVKSAIRELKKLKEQQESKTHTHTGNTFAPYTNYAPDEGIKAAAYGYKYVDEALIQRYEKLTQDKVFNKEELVKFMKSYDYSWLDLSACTSEIFKKDGSTNIFKPLVGVVIDKHEMYDYQKKMWNTTLEDNVDSWSISSTTTNDFTWMVNTAKATSVKTSNNRDYTFYKLLVGNADTKEPVSLFFQAKALIKID